MAIQTVTPGPSPSPLTPLSERPPAGDPAQQARLQPVGGRRQAGGPGVAGRRRRGGPLQLQQRQVIVVGLGVVVLVQVDPLDPDRLLRWATGTPGAQQQLAQVHGPQRGGVQAAET